MPRNQFQRMVYAFITVFITVNAFVFYNIYVVSGSALMEKTHTTNVFTAINTQGGIYMFGNFLPILGVIGVEFACAYALEILFGSPYSFKIALKMFDPRKTNPIIFETAIICSTVAIMCPSMSFLASIMYYPYYMGFNVFELLANWFKLVCFNLPFAFFSQLLFIQPLVRRLFRLIFAKDIKNRMRDASENAVKVNVQSTQSAVEE